MRVLHAADYGNPAPGGFIPLVAALARRLAVRGDAFALAVPDVPAASWHDAIRAAGGELRLVDGAAEAARFAAAWKPDVLHVHFFGWELALTLALWRSPARIVWHAHSAARAGAARATPRSLVKYRLAGARVAMHVAVSAAIAEELVRRGAPRERVVVVPNAVDPRRFRPPSGEERRAARAALGIADGEAAVVFYGRDPVVKGADLLRDALARLRGATVVAVATPEPVRSALAAHARVIAIERSDEVRELLWAVDALAIPSRAEGAPLAFLEAARCGLPIAAGDLPALREAGAGYDGIFYAPLGDADALAGALRRALATGPVVPPPTAYDPDAWAERITDLYTGVRVAPASRSALAAGSDCGTPSTTCTRPPR